MGIEHGCRAVLAHAHDGVVAGLSPEEGAREPALELLGARRHPGAERDDRRAAAARQGRVAARVVLEDDVEDDVRVGGVAVVPVGAEQRRADVQLDIAAHRHAGGTGDDGAAEVGPGSAPRAALEDDVDGHAGARHEGALREAPPPP